MIGHMLSTPHTWLHAFDTLYLVACFRHFILGWMFIDTSYLVVCLLRLHAWLHAFQHLILGCMHCDTSSLVKNRQEGDAFVCLERRWLKGNFKSIIIKTMVVTHDVRLSSSHKFTKLFHCIVSQPFENIALILKLAVVLTYRKDPKVIIYSLWIGSLLMETSSNRYSL